MAVGRSLIDDRLSAAPGRGRLLVPFFDSLYSWLHVPTTNDFCERKASKPGSPRTAASSSTSSARIDLSKIEAERAMFVRYNRSLTNYYARALTKERRRDHLLKQELGMDKVVHYVVSRFPVIGADPAVINYNQIDRLRFASQAGA
ncbi:hypothetical protein [Bradyrhizobium sp. USDA 3315]